MSKTLNTSCQLWLPKLVPLGFILSPGHGLPHTWGQPPPESLTAPLWVPLHLIMVLALSVSVFGSSQPEQLKGSVCHIHLCIPGAWHVNSCLKATEEDANHL